VCGDSIDALAVDTALPVALLVRSLASASSFGYGITSEHPLCSPLARPFRRVTFTTEQRTRVRTTVLQDSNAPRATNVNFSINVGTAVPTSVRVVTIPQLILDVQPEWRGHMYFIVGDQIIIVDRNHRIVAVIDV
jgi:hypothetical protein